MVEREQGSRPEHRPAGRAPAGLGWYSLLATRYFIPLRVGAVAAIIAVVVGLCSTIARNGLHWDQEMALYPWLLRNGWVLSRDIRDQHGPLFPAILSLLPDPGSAGTEFVVDIALIALVATLLAVAAWRTAGPVAALFATGLYALWVLPFDGAHLWYDLGLAPFYLAAYLVGLAILNKPSADWRFAALGLLMGCAVLLKQQAIIAALCALVLVPLRPLRSVALYIGAAGLPILISLLAFLGVGSLGDYLYWVGAYNLTSDYVVSGSSAVPSTEWPFMLALFACVPALVLSSLHLRDRWRTFGRLAFFTGGLLLAAIIAIWPRYARFHLAASLPILALLGGIAIWNLLRGFPGFRKLTLLAWIGGVLLILFTLRMTGPSGVRALTTVWRSQPAPLPYSATSGPLRTWVQANTPADRPILVYDLDATLYRVLERRPPRPWSPLFPWILEGNSTSAQWLAGIETERPGIALVTPEFVAGRHLPLPDNGLSETYLRTHYVAGPLFTVQKYPDSGQQKIVALQLSAP